MAAVTEHELHGEDERDGPAPLAWLTWPKLVVLVAAFAWAAGALTWAWTEWSDRPPGRGSVEVGFLQDMAVHHEQAVEMAMLELGRGQDPTAVTFAKEILVWQSYELGLIDQQLASWGYGRREPEEPAMAWMGMATVPAAMPGMATEAEVDALAAASGAEADEMFLQLMTEHHAGGVHMAAYAAEHADEPDVRELARRFERNQAIEITEFRLAAERLDVELDPGSVALGRSPLHDDG